MNSNRGGRDFSDRRDHILWQEHSAPYHLSLDAQMRRTFLLRF